MSNRVVITGLGVVSPVGTGKEAFWDAMMSGKNGIDKITRFDAAEYKAQIAGEVKDFDPADYMDKKESKRIDRYAQFAMAAAKLAVEDAKLDLEQENLERIGTFVGSGIGVFCLRYVHDFILFFCCCSIHISSHAGRYFLQIRLVGVF